MDLYELNVEFFVRVFMDIMYGNFDMRKDGLIVIPVGLKQMI
jgi:hypothetical protein